MSVHIVDLPECDRVVVFLDSGPAAGNAVMVVPLTGTQLRLSCDKTNSRPVQRCPAGN